MRAVPAGTARTAHTQAGCCVPRNVACLACLLMATDTQVLWHAGDGFSAADEVVPTKAKYCKCVSPWTQAWGKKSPILELDISNSNGRKTSHIRCRGWDRWVDREATSQDSGINYRCRAHVSVVQCQRKGKTRNHYAGFSQQNNLKNFLSRSVSLFHFQSPPLAGAAAGIQLTEKANKPMVPRGFLAEYSTY